MVTEDISCQLNLSHVVNAATQRCGEVSHSPSSPPQFEKALSLCLEDVQRKMM